MHDFAVIVPTRNRPDILHQNLVKTRVHFPSVPIYVFDDASDNAEAVRLAVNSIDRITLIRSDRNVGPAGARRRLIEEADARWVLAIDDDCYPRDDFEPSRWIKSEPKKGEPIVIGLRCYRSYDGDVSPLGRETPGPFPAFHGGASLLHRQRVLEIGNYDASYFFAAEDTDVARRVWANGYEVWLDTESFIVHDHVAAGRNLKREAFYYVRNRIVLSAMTLPLWYGLPLGLGQAVKRWLSQPHKAAGFAGLINGLGAVMVSLPRRKPLSLKQWRAISALQNA